MSSHDYDTPDHEQYVETRTESVELEYGGGSLCRVLVTATHETGHTVESATAGAKRPDETVTAHVEYTVRGDTAELTGLYPETSKTGRQLYRETLRTLRVLEHAYEEVQTRVDEDIDVQHFNDALGTQLHYSG